MKYMSHTATFMTILNSLDRYKAQQQLMEQDVHNRDLQTRSDHEAMLWEREMYQQDLILANARQQMLLQRDMM